MSEIPRQVLGPSPNGSGNALAAKTVKKLSDLEKKLATVEPQIATAHADLTNETAPAVDKRAALPAISSRNTHENIQAMLQRIELLETLVHDELQPALATAEGELAKNKTARNADRATRALRSANSTLDEAIEELDELRTDIQDALEDER